MIVFDHIAVALERVESASSLLSDAFGGFRESGTGAGGFRWAAWRFRGGGCLEVLEPMGQDGFLHRFLVRHGPGIHHVTFRVPSVDEACDRARGYGYSIVGYDDSDPRWAEAFLHPKQALGIVVQLAEVRSGTGEDGPRRSPISRAGPRPTVTILGLRTRARSRGRAQTQWQHILGGQCVADTERELIYRWPRSSMRLAVEIAPAGEEGPATVEFTSDRPVVFPETAHPVLRSVLTERHS